MVCRLLSRLRQTLFSKMFARFARLPLRRCLHTQASSSQARFPLNRAAYAIGGSAVVASYITWQLSSDSNRILLDSEKSIVGKQRWLFDVSALNQMSV